MVLFVKLRDGRHIGERCTVSGGRIATSPRLKTVQETRAQLERVRLTDKFSDKYNEPLIFEEWAARHGVIYSLEDEHGLRGSFDECVATMLREGTHRQVHSRLLLACSRSS